MRLIRLILPCAASLLVIVASGAPNSAGDQPSVAHSHAAAPHVVHWGYGDHDGPAAWGQLSGDFRLCAEGRSQSPIDFAPSNAERKGGAAGEAALDIARSRHVVDMVDNGHSIEVDDAGGSTLKLAGASYALVQFHFHAPSEHTVGGRHYPMELHLVHRNPTGGLAVLGVFIEQGAINEAIARLWAHLPHAPGPADHFEVAVDVDALLPPQRLAHRYDGSLTTPPCSEGVKWLVFVEPIQMSSDQIAAFKAVIPDNNRPVQALNGRGLTTVEVGVH